jgi:predicted phosphate transport protein (TIGR00153 family)
MFSFLFKKENRVETLIFDYLDSLKLTQESFLDTINACLEDSKCDDFEFLITQTHKHESKADDICDEINDLMYSKALIPDSRGDIMELLEAIDIIPHLFERVLFVMQTQKVSIPEFLALDVKDLIRISLESCDLLSKQLALHLKQKPGIRALLGTIDTNESHCDYIERRIISKIFDSDLDPFIKLQLKELIVIMGEISDQADRVSRRINIINMKRRV